MLARSLEQRLADYGFKEYEMPVNQMSGPQTRPADLPLAVPLDSVKHYEDYIARLHQIPRAFTQTEEVLRARVSRMASCRLASCSRKYPCSAWA